MSSSICDSDWQSNGCKTTIDSDEARYVWTIEDFDFHEAKGERLYSPPFSSVKDYQVKWYLGLYPNAEIDTKDHVSLFIFLSKLSSLEKSKKIFAKATFLILNSENEEKFKKSLDIMEFSHPDIENSGWGIKKFIKKDAKFRNKLLSNKNTLTIRCEVKFSDMSRVHHGGSGIEMPECDLSENFAALIKNHTLTDVVLSVNGKDFPAHKTVLVARSPVFCAMFKHSTKENELNRIDIEDINETVVEGMLNYIYTGKCDDLDELAEGLLAAANKYDLGRLKIMCAKKLIEGLSVENAANVLVLADMHHQEDLKRGAIKFIVANFTHVFITAAWQNMLLSSPQLTNEVRQAIARM